MTKKSRRTAQAASHGGDQASPKKKAEALTWGQERFVEAYIENGGNATRAYLKAKPGVTYDTASTEGAVWLGKPCIKLAIEEKKLQWAEALNFDRNKALRLLVGIATARVSDFTQVLSDPTNKDNYAGLGDSEYAIKSASHSYKVGNDVQLYDRMAAINNLWEKLGLDKTAGKDDRISFLERFTSLGAKLGRSGSGGGPASGEGSP